MIYSLISVLAGAGGALSFAPFSMPIFSFLSLQILFYIWLTPRRNRLARDGYAFGVGFFGAGLYWVYKSLFYYGGASLIFAILANLFLVALLSFYIAAAGWAVQKTSAPQTWRRALLIAFFWTLSELLRAYLFSGFPWLLVGYGYLGSWLDAFAPIGGVYLVGFVVVFLISLLAQAACVRKGQLPILLIFLGFFSLAHVIGKINFTRESGAPIKVALIQGNIDQLTKFDGMQMEVNLQTYLDMALAQRDADVIILPETAMPFIKEILDDSLLPVLKQQFLLRKQTLITGIISGNMAEDQYFNSIIAIGKDSGQYDKRHLLPFGETIPLRWLLTLFEYFVEIPYNTLQAGAAEQKPLQIGGHAVGTSICFEAAFGREIRHSFPDANYLINISNDGWFRDSIAAPQHLQMNQMRAREFGREMARATNDGMTAIINARGEIVTEISRGVRAVLRGEIVPRTGLTPYARFGNAVIVALLALYAALIFGWGWWKKRTSAP